MARTKKTNEESKQEVTVVDVKKVNYETWLESFNLAGEEEKASKSFDLPSSKRKEVVKDGKKELKFTKKASVRSPKNALNKLCQKNTIKAQIFLQNLRNDLDISKLVKQEEDLLKNKELSDENYNELVKVQEKLKTVKADSKAFTQAFGTPTFTEVTADMFAFVMAWVVNPEKGNEYKVDGNTSKVYDIHFAGMEIISRKLIKYFNEYLDTPETTEKVRAMRELKDELNSFCNKFLKKSYDIGYKNTKVDFNNEMLKLSSSFTYAGVDKKTKRPVFKDAYAIIHNVLHIALAYNYGVFDKEEVGTKAARKFASLGSETSNTNE